MSVQEASNQGKDFNYQNVMGSLKLMYNTDNLKLEPAVYVLQKDKTTKEIKAIKDVDRFVLPPKLYGGLDKFGNRCWNTFATFKESMGCLFLGAKGNGKTELTKYISNIAISFGLPVITVVNIEVDHDVLRFIHNLSDVVVVFEEFGKVVPYHFQEKMLSVLSSFNGKKKLYIVNDNDKNSISRYIIGRAGRFRYIKEFYRATRPMVKEYLDDFNINKELKEDILNLHDKSTTFSMDDLIHLVDEHKKYPEDTLEELLDILNVSIENKQPCYVVDKVIDIEKDEEMDYDKTTMPKLEFDTGRTYWINVSEKVKQEVKTPETTEPPTMPDFSMPGMPNMPFGRPSSFNSFNNFPVPKINIKISNKKVVRAADTYTIVNDDTEKYQVKLIFKKD